MSNLGYINNSYGKPINIAIANTYGYNVLSGNNLPDNTIIISAPTDEINDDRDIYSILMTDYKGIPVRMSYTLKKDNSMAFFDDSLHVQIDNNTIIEENNQITANINALIDNNTIVYDNSYLYMKVNNFNKISSDNKGIFKIDNNTIKESDGKLYAITENLQYVNNETGAAGIFIGDNKTVKVNQGIISIDQEYLDKANKDNYGVIIGDNNMVITNEGNIEIITENLDKCLDSQAGIVIPDNETICINENNELTVNTQNMQSVTSNNAGVFKYDPDVFVIDKDILKVKDYNKINNLISNIKSVEEKLNKQIKDLDYLLENYQIGIQNPDIFDFHCTNLLSAVLEKPLYLDQPIDEMKTQFISTDFVISTNCPFIISIEYENNTDPQISLYSINYNTINIFNGNSGLLETYQTTQGKQVPIRFTFIAKNYFKNDKKEYSKNVKIKITVSYVNDVTINKSIIYSIVRFNSAYNEEIIYDDTNIENYID